VRETVTVASKNLFGEDTAAPRPAPPVRPFSGVLVPILLPVALDQTYDYAVPGGLDLQPGQFVLVPFGPQSRIGIVWDAPVGEQKSIDPKKIKTVIEVLDVPPLPDISLRFAEWIAKYTLSPLGMVARMMMGTQALFEPQKLRTGVRCVEGANRPPKMTEARQKALDIALCA
jgi:primosomal protein N' (replication factor Y) (superfamily II helicase)